MTTKSKRSPLYYWGMGRFAPFSIIADSSDWDMYYAMDGFLDGYGDLWHIGVTPDGIAYTYPCSELESMPEIE